MYSKPHSRAEFIRILDSPHLFLEHHKNLTEIILPNIANKVTRSDSHTLLFGSKEGSRGISDYIFLANFCDVGFTIIMIYHVSEWLLPSSINHLGIAPGWLLWPLFVVWNPSLCFVLSKFLCSLTTDFLINESVLLLMKRPCLANSLRSNIIINVEVGSGRTSARIENRNGCLEESISLHGCFIVSQPIDAPQGSRSSSSVTIFTRRQTGPSNHCRKAYT